MSDIAGIAAVSALNDPLRRRLFDYVAAHQEGVGREQAATALQIAPHTARFHLDRLVEAGLLDSEFRRLSGRTGPGAGRPAKVYRRVDGDVSVSIPPRHYDLVGRLLAAAVRRSLSGAPLALALTDEARAAGVRDGAEEAGEAAGVAAGEGDELDRVRAALAGRGYQPQPAEEGLLLHNCPFDSVVAEYPEMVCGLNHDYVTGLVQGLGCCRTRAVLDPAPGRCCVRIRAGDPADCTEPADPGGPAGPSGPVSPEG